MSKRVQFRTSLDTESLAMPITMPSDLGAELLEAARWYAGEPEMELFRDHVRAQYP
jgi:hypothetical protein